MDLNVKVAVRCRPMSKKEIARGCKNIAVITPKTVAIKSPEGNEEDKQFTFDNCYDETSTQMQVYSDIGKGIVAQALDGFNGTVFAYGQTGSGKTFSMMGTDDNKGIIPLMNEDLWVTINQKLQSLAESNADGTVNTKFMVTCSFLEVYNEEIKDLLNPGDRKLDIRESPDKGIFVKDLAELIVRDPMDLLRLIYQGNAVRKVASTNMNDQSSRSHSVFTIKMEQKTSTQIADGLMREQLIKAKINLVDLAGSERADKTGATGSTLKEGANINLSLLALGNVINALSEGLKKGGHKKVIPYRESKLTRLLQESLGGNAHTVMIASISPADYNFAETVGTLKYANRAKSIENAVTRNEDDNEKVVRELQAQIEMLKSQLAGGGGGGSGGGADNPELQKKLKEMEENQNSAWQERERLSKELEEERSSNMNNVISSMMQGVKEQKVHHMKTIKRLTNEKASLTSKFKEYKEFNATLKSTLDEAISKYQLLQKGYDDVTTRIEEEGESEELHAESESIANDMVTLLTQIESDRQRYTEKRDELKRIRLRLDSIDGEVQEARAELVATDGVLKQNDKIREQIQQEEREKLRIEMEKELGLEKAKLEEERTKVSGAIRGELEGEMGKLNSEIVQLKAQLKSEQNKNDAALHDQEQLARYAEELEQRLADSEVEKEFAQAETENAFGEIRLKESELKSLQEETTSLHQELNALKKESVHNIEALKEELTQIFEQQKFQMFTALMDGFNEERQKFDARHHSVNELLHQASKDVQHLLQKNAELQKSLNDAIYYEPNIK